MAASVVEPAAAVGSEPAAGGARVRPVDPRLLSESPGARSAVLGLGGLGICTGVATIAQALAIAWLVTDLVDRRPLALPLALTVLAFVARAVCSAAGEAWAARAGARISIRLRERLLTGWLTRSADERPDPERALVLAGQGASAIEAYVARFLPALVSAVVLPAFALVTMVVVDPLSALIAVLTVPLLPIFAALIGATTAEDTRRRWGSLSRLSGHFLDVVRGLPTLVNYGRAEAQVETIGRVSRQHAAATMRTLRLAFLSSAAMELLATLSVAIVAVAVGLRLAGGSLDLRTGLAAILLAPEVYWPVRRVGAEFHNSADGAAALAEILDELAAPAVAARMPAAAPPAATTRAAGMSSAGAAYRPGVLLRDIGYRYPGRDRCVLDGLSATLPNPGLSVITGPSGAGKSTLLELLAGLRAPTGGELSGTADRHLLTQRPFLVAATLAENLRLGPARTATDAQLWESLDAVGLGELIRSRPEGLNLPLGDNGFGLSAGQRARVGLARAILSGANVLLLDEPTAHLDPAGSVAINRLLCELARERAVIVVSHRPELLNWADAHLAIPAAKAAATVGAIR